MVNNRASPPESFHYGQSAHYYFAIFACSLQRHILLVCYECVRRHPTLYVDARFGRAPHRSGITLLGKSGRTPLSSGTATFSARVTDSSSASVAEPFTLTVSQGAPPTAIETWSARSPADAVSNAVYDAGRNEIVLLGMSGTWIYNNGQWTERLNVTPPIVRGSTTMAYDIEHRRIVMFGGFSSPGTLLNDTWTWDGTSWTQMSPSTSPPSRTNHSMTYDAAHGVILLFGGDASDGVTHYSDTWIWDGANWTQQFPVISPPARSGNSPSFTR